MNIQFFRTHFYKKIIEYNIEINNIKQAKQFIDQLINEENIELDIPLYGTIKKLLTPKQKEKALQKILFADKDKTYGTLAIDYMEQKDYAKADKYFDMAEQLRLNFPSKKTSKLYRAIIKKLVDNNIKVICMQYPVRSIKPLQNILKDTDYYDKITFISNEKTFKQVLKEKSFGVIFIDQFAGDFGHCTEYGNTLIAENVAKTLIDLITN